MTTPDPAGQASAPSIPNPNDPTGQAPANPTSAGNPAPWERDGTPFDATRASSLIRALRGDLATARAGQNPNHTSHTRGANASGPRATGGAGNDRAIR